ncbi:MAG: TetR/AcrR family transcriptional regulator [Ilumatobacter sp.]|uniref:TetR/AcrR family transcriptional regulator n=1 Tax=Ilumatobacter sp. TaxID=1967498 RepID=UPI00391C98DE
MARTQIERSAETRRAINEATIRSLVEAGYASTTTSAVCDRAGVSRGALTHHFSSKQEMMTAAITHLSEVRERQLSKRASELADGPDRTQAVIELLWESFTSDLFYASLELWNAARTDRALHETLYRAERDLGARHRVLVAEMFGEPLAAHPHFDRVVDMMFRQLRGASVTRILRGDAHHEDAVIGDLVTAIAAMTAMSDSVAGGLDSTS